jgi:hypothetical protein
MRKVWLQYIFAYGMWLVALLLGVWFLLTSRVGVHAYLTLYYAGNSITRLVQAGLLDQVYFLLVGLLWLILMIVSEEYFRKGIGRKDLFHRVIVIIAPELLLTAFSDIFLIVVLGIYQQTWLFWLRLFVELIAAGFLFYLAVVTRQRKTFPHA